MLDISSMKEYKDVKIHIPQDYIDFAEYIKSLGIKIYFVGGCVRDALLDIYYDDFDFFCLCKKEYFKSKIEGYKEIIDFDRVLVLYCENRHTYFTIGFAETFEQDYLLRDFSVNSLYYDHAANKIFGFNQSVEDLQYGILITCNYGIFKNDDIHKLRAVRFEEKLGFSLEHNILVELYRMDFENIKTRLDAIRLRNEFNKHKVETLTKYKLVKKIVEKLNEFEIKV